MGNYQTNIEMSKTANASPILNSDLNNNKYVLEPITEDKALNTPNKFAIGAYQTKRAHNYRPSKTIQPQIPGPS